MWFRGFQVYRVSQFGCNCWISRLLVKIEPCGFREPELLFCETKHAANQIGIALLVSKLQGDIVNVAFSGTPCISVVWQLVEKVKTNPFRTFYIESSGVVTVFLKKIFFEIHTKPVFFKWNTLYIYILSFLLYFSISKNI